MLAPAIAAIKAYIAANYTGLPIKWQNEPWQGNNPQDTGAAFLEIEIVGGQNALTAFSTPGNRLFIHPGIIRFYICESQGTGIEGALAVADALSAAMQRKEFGQTADQTVRTQDFSVYDDVASHEDGNYFVLMASCPFDFYYAG